MAKKIFNHAFEAYGPLWRFPDETAIETQALRHLLDLFSEAVKTQKKAIGPNGYIYCDLIDNPSFNALATTYENYEFVTLFSGAINHIYSVYFTLLSDPDILSSVGDALDETVSEDALSIIRSGLGTQGEIPLPRDTQRVQIARDLSLFTCLFLLFHEIGHIVRGHPTFLLRKYGLSVYEELPVSSIEKEQRNIHLAFEWEADEFAAITSYQLVRSMLQRSSVFPAIKHLDTEYVWSISVSMLFMIIGRFSGGMDIQSSTHPRPFFRHIWSMLSVESAEECQKFSPKTTTLQEGFNDIGSWFKKHSIGLTQEEHIFSDEVIDDLTREFNEEYLGAKHLLLEESVLLNDIRNERSFAAEKWRERQSE